MPKSLETGVVDWIDPDDAPELPDDWFDGGEGIWEVGGVPIPTPTPEKPYVRRPDVAVSLSLPAEMVDYFAAPEPGWEGRIVEALREAILRRTWGPDGRGPFGVSAPSGRDGGA